MGTMPIETISVCTVVPAILLLLLLNNSVHVGSEYLPEESKRYVDKWPPTPSKTFQAEFNFELNWHGAFMYCLRHGGRLASIYSQEENDAAVAAIRSTGIKDGFFWTSGTDVSSRQWMWMSSGQVVNYTNWFGGEPNNDGSCGGSCIMLEERKGVIKWDDGHCYLGRNFVCEYYNL